ncbi:MAG: deaminase [Rhabdochlamydiaceae bacterium]|nr:deaminase [Candidatus Amphrikana amoebophyrae]
MKVLSLQQIKSAIDIKDAIELQEQGFKLYSEKKVDVPPVGYINFGDDVGDVHIKSGWVQGDDIFVVKIMGAYHKNRINLGIENAQGSLLAFDAQTGVLKALLNDEGYLTNLRTAIAGLIVAKRLAPKKVTSIGILGTGVQARLQLELLKHFTDCKRVYLWGRTKTNLNKCRLDMQKLGFDVTLASSPKEVAQSCNLIVTTTPSTEPLLMLEDIQQGTHITAVGADSPGKQELDPRIIERADLICVDSKDQCLDHGEISNAPNIGENDIQELGELLKSNELYERDKMDITIADLTGVSVQDIQIVKAIYDQT